MLTCALSLLLVAQVVDPKPDENRFVSLEWRSESSPDRIYRYRLFVPTRASAENRKPLLVWLHGFGERGEDNGKMLRWIPLLFEAAGDRPSLFVLVTQHHSDEGDWTAPAPGQSEDALSVTYQIAQQVIAQYPIDPDRVYLAGVSSGATAAWELACRHPQTFAALIPMSSRGGNPNRVTQLTKIPIWAFNCSVDTQTPPEIALPTVRAVQVAGGVAELTATDQVTDGTPHNSWNEAFRKYHVLDWLLAQRRGQPGPAPGVSAFSQSWQWLRDNGWVPAVWLALATAAILLWRHSRRVAAPSQVSDLKSQI